VPGRPDRDIPIRALSSTRRDFAPAAIHSLVHWLRTSSVLCCLGISSDSSSPCISACMLGIQQVNAAWASYFLSKGLRALAVSIVEFRRHQAWSLCRVLADYSGSPARRSCDQMDQHVLPRSEPGATWNLARASTTRPCSRLRPVYPLDDDRLWWGILSKGG
jgi:hypothetical protein